MKDGVTFLLILTAIGFLVLAVWSSLYAPCSVYRGQPLKDVLARCLKEYVP